MSDPSASPSKKSLKGTKTVASESGGSKLKQSKVKIPNDGNDVHVAYRRRSASNKKTNVLTASTTSNKKMISASKASSVKSSGGVVKYKAESWIRESKSGAEDNTRVGSRAIDWNKLKASASTVDSASSRKINSVWDSKSNEVYEGKVESESTDVNMVYSKRRMSIRRSSSQLSEKMLNARDSIGLVKSSGNSTVNSGNISTINSGYNKTEATISRVSNDFPETTTVNSRETVGPGESASTRQVSTQSSKNAIASIQRSSTASGLSGHRTKKHVGFSSSIITAVRRRSSTNSNVSSKFPFDVDEDGEFEVNPSSSDIGVRFSSIIKVVGRDGDIVDVDVGQDDRGIFVPQKIRRTDAERPDVNSRPKDYPKPVSSKLNREPDRSKERLYPLARHSKSIDLNIHRDRGMAILRRLYLDYDSDREGEGGDDTGKKKKKGKGKASQKNSKSKLEVSKSEFKSKSEFTSKSEFKSKPVKGSKSKKSALKSKPVKESKSKKSELESKPVKGSKSKKSELESKPVKGSKSKKTQGSKKAGKSSEVKSKSVMSVKPEVESKIDKKVEKDDSGSGLVLADDSVTATFEERENKGKAPAEKAKPIGSKKGNEKEKDKPKNEKVDKKVEKKKPGGMLAWTKYVREGSRIESLVPSFNTGNISALQNVFPTGLHDYLQQFVRRSGVKNDPDIGLEDLTKLSKGCDEPEAKYVKLISSDGHEFIVKREHALTSGTIKALLTGPSQFAGNETSAINFREIPSHVLQQVCKFFMHKARYANDASDNPIPQFSISPEMALELLTAANFLDC